MSIESNGVHTNSGDNNTTTPEFKPSRKYSVSENTAFNNSKIDFGKDNAESSIFANDSSFSPNNATIRDWSHRPNTKRYLSVPPLGSNLYAFPKVFESHSANSEFQALHPNRPEGNQLTQARIEQPNTSPQKSADVIDLTYHPDPYRALKQNDNVSQNKDTSLESRRVVLNDNVAVKLESNRITDSSGVQNAQEVNRSSDAILGSSYRNLNGKPWAKSEYAHYVDKSLAGAASVSQILQEQGFDYANSGSVSNLAKKLLVNGWQLVPKSQAQPGDVIFGGRKGTNWRNTRGASDIGIVGTNDQIFHSDSSTGEWRLNKQSRVFSKGQYGDQVWVLRAPDKPVLEQASNRELSGNIQFERNFQGNNCFDCYRCARNCRYFDEFARRQEGQPKSYWKGNKSAAEQGALDGRRAYQEMKQRNSAPSDRNSRGIDLDEHFRQNRNDKNIEDPNKYWNDYWKNYWRDYWKDYYSKRNDGSDNQIRPNNSPRGDHGRSIHDAAKGKIGQSVWQSSPHADKLQNGRLGSATSVSEILKSLGYSYATSPGVANLAKQLLSAGWTPVKLTELRPGDVIYGAKSADWEKGGGKSHMSIVSEDGYVLHNDSNTGKFKQDRVGDVYDQATYGNRIWALRPPADGPASRPQHRPGSDTREYRPPTDTRRGPGNDIIKGFENIVNAALTSVGKQMFRPMLSYAMGRLGCAASVSGVLKKAGYGYANHAGVYGLTQQLRKNGWTKHPVSEARPGDVIYGIRRSSWKNGGGGSHIGIVGEGNTSYHNSSSRRQWIKDSLSRWNTSRYRLGVYVLRPPQR